MRNIAEILKDDRNGKQLSQTERQIAVAYTQGKYDAVRELKIGNNSNINWVCYHFGAYYVCSCCNERNNRKDKFCPNCGADMRGE